MNIATIKHTTELITKRERSSSEQFKVDAMHDFLDVLANEDVDSMFISMFAKGSELEYKLTDTPENILANIEKKFNAQKTLHSDR